MKFRGTALIFLLVSVFFFGCVTIRAENYDHMKQIVPETAETEEYPQIRHETEKQEEAGGDPGHLYALSAVLMDGDSGRVLYEKEGETPRPNASTTKVLTCMLALEYGAGDDYVTVSARAASQPDVQLNIEEGEQYYLEDLLYSLMLQSHNDTAVAIAEHIGGSVEGFASMLNKKAEEIGCTDTHFVTPNGLDAEDEGGSHHTTARDLALIMRYAIKNRTFLKITETREYTFSDISGKRTFTVHNTNAFLDMTDGVLSGKTGFTGDAGYCYVCACTKSGKTFIISLLGCGWPNNKTYKWKDAMTLLNYGDQNYEYKTFFRQPELPVIPVENGVPESGGFEGEASVPGTMYVSGSEKEKEVLLRNDEKIECRVAVKKKLTAPVTKGEEIGKVTFLLNGKALVSYPVVADQNVEEISYLWCVDQVFHNFFHE